MTSGKYFEMFCLNLCQFCFLKKPTWKMVLKNTGNAGRSISLQHVVTSAKSNLKQTAVNNVDLKCNTLTPEPHIHNYVNVTAVVRMRHHTSDHCGPFLLMYGQTYLVKWPVTLYTQGSYT